MRIFFRSQLLFVPASTWNCAAFASALSRPFDFRASDSLFVIAADLMRRSVAPSQESACWCSSDSGVGSFFRANCNCSRHSSQLLYDKQFGNCKKNVLEPMTQIAMRQHGRNTCVRYNYQQSRKLMRIIQTYSVVVESQIYPLLMLRLKLCIILR